MKADASSESSRSTARLALRSVLLPLFAIAAAGFWLAPVMLPPKSVAAPLTVPPATTDQDALSPAEASIELIALSKLSAEPSPWWQPTGAPFTADTFQITAPALEDRPGRVPLVLVFRTHGFPPGKRPSLLWRVEVAGNPVAEFTPATLLKNGQPAGEEYHAQITYLPPTAPWAKFSVGFQQGPWEAIQEFDVATRKGTGLASWNTLFSPPTEAPDQSSELTVSYRNHYQPTRFIAVDHEGQTHVGEKAKPDTVFGGALMSTVTFRGLPASRIKSLRLESPSYRWEQFSGAALQQSPVPPPKLEYLAWGQLQDRKLATSVLWSADGSRRENTTVDLWDIAFLDQTTGPHELKERGPTTTKDWPELAPDDPARFAPALLLRFSAANFDPETTRITLLDAKGNALPLRDGPSAVFSSMRYFGPGGPGQSLTGALRLRDSAAIPSRITVRLRTVLEPCEHLREFPPSAKPGFVLRAGVSLESIGETPQGRTFVRLKYEGSAASEPSLTDAIAPVTSPTPGISVTGISVTGISVTGISENTVESQYFPETKTRLLTFEFSTRLQDVRAFSLCTRLLRTIDYSKVSIFPMDAVK